MGALAKLLANKTVLIGAGILILVLVIYFAGKRAGAKCSWYDKLTGSCDEDGKKIIYQDAGSDEWKPNAITDNIYNQIHNHRWYDSNGEGINTAFQAFNSLSSVQKIAVVNDWRNRIYGQDQSGWGTGNYDTLKKTIEAFSGNFQTQVEIAYNWMIANGIE